MKNLCLLLSLSLLFSCNNDDCINDIVGTYSGTCTSAAGTSQGDVIIFESPEGGSRLLIQDGVSAFSGFEGILSGNCKTITISSQFVTDINGASFSVSGSLRVHGSSISGEVRFDGSTDSECSYDLMKN